MNERTRQLLRRQVKFFYDIQRCRLQTGGRVLGQSPQGVIQLDPADLEHLEKRHAELEGLEKNLLKDVQATLNTIPIYKDVLTDKTRYKGLGPTMSAVILSEFDITKADTVSKMWAFSGLAPTDCKRCKQCHVVVAAVASETTSGTERAKHEESPNAAERASDRDTSDSHKRASTQKPPDEPERAIATESSGERQRTYKHPRNIKGVKCKLAEEMIEPHQVYDSSKTMKPTKNQKLPYNAFLRMKLVGVLGPVLIKVGSPWRKVYDDYKHRLISKGWGISDGHRHQAAIRYMVKMLLLDIWKEWRAAEGLPVRAPYHEEKLGHVHSAARPAAPPSEHGEVSDTFADRIIAEEMANL